MNKLLIGPRLRLAVMAIAVGTAGPALAASKAAGLKGDPGEFFGPDEYPAEALAAHQQGRVVAKLWVDTTGKVASCAVQRSSGSRSLDAKTCQIALDRVTFTPATDRRGRPIASDYLLPVRWLLPSGPMEVADMPMEWRLEQTMSVDSAGEVVACTASFTPPKPEAADPCAEWPVGTKLPNPWLRDGKPVGGTVKREVHERVILDP